MLNKPGFYIVTEKGDPSKTKHLLWVGKKKDGLYYQLDNGLPQKLDRAHEYDLNQFHFEQEMAISRHKMEFSNTYIHIKTSYGQHTFSFTMRDLLGFLRLVELLPGIAKDLMFKNFLKKLSQSLEHLRHGL